METRRMARICDIQLETGAAAFAAAAPARAPFTKTQTEKTTAKTV
jgi:hypothetical protein